MMNIRLLLTLCAISLMLVSCSKDDLDDAFMSDNEMGQLLAGEKDAYVVVGDDHGIYCELTDDLERKWLLDKRTDTQFAKGRARISYQLYSGQIQGFDVLARLNTIIYYNTTDAVVSPTAAELEAMGNDPITISNAHISENGKWIDIDFQVFTVNATGGSHELSLAVIPEGDDYYCVLYHKGQNVVHGSMLLFGNVSFILPDEVNPVKRGKEGIQLYYIDVLNVRHNLYLTPNSTN